MTKLYKKNELMFALVWIAIYVVGTSLAEALCEFGIGGILGKHDLEGDDTAQNDILGLENLGHAANAEPLDDLTATGDQLANH